MKFQILLLFAYSLLYSESKMEIKTTHWKKELEVKSYTRDIPANTFSGLTYKVEIKNKSDGITLADFTNFYIGSFYKTRDDIFMVLTPVHSGGESGCCYYDKEKIIGYIDGKIQTIAEFSADDVDYSQIVDMDGDGIEEIRQKSTIGYGSYKLNSSCEYKTVYPNETGHTGMPEIIFPHYFIIKKNKKGYYLEEVTFTKKFKKFLIPYFQKVELTLLKGKTQKLEEGDFSLISIYQYYYYMKKIGLESKALKKIKDSQIYLVVDCDKKKNQKFFLKDVLK